MNFTTLAVKYLTWRLRKDKNFWETYQANIAMTMYDAFLRYTNLQGTISCEKLLGRPLLHTICNEGATNFMNLWCSQKRVGK